MRRTKQQETISVSEAIEKLQEVARLSEQDDLEDNENYAMMVGDITDGLRAHVKATTGFII